MKYNFGMRESANDVTQIRSVIDEVYFLNNKTWLLSVLEDSKDRIWLLEQRTSQGDHILEGRTCNPYLSHIEVKRINRAYLLEMVKVRSRKQTKGRTGKEDDGEGDPAGDCARSTRGRGERNRTEEGTNAGNEGGGGRGG